MPTLTADGAHDIDDDDDDDDDGVIDVSLTSWNHNGDDVRDQWRHSARHHHNSDRGECC